MNYELAKQLKDAGFSQKGAGRVASSNTPFVKGNKIDYVDEHFYIPTLSELIEACGDRFLELALLDNGKWYAAGGEGRVYHHEMNNFSTPEIAVANLWLELNKK